MLQVVPDQSGIDIQIDLVTETKLICFSAA